TLTNVTPSYGPVGSLATVQGNGFLTFDVSSVCVGSSCTTAHVVDDNNVEFAVTPSMQTGKVAVSGTQGFATRGFGLTVGTSQAPPTITGFTPTSGPQGTSVALMGTHFTGMTDIAVNGTHVSSFVVASDTSATGTVAPGSTTGSISVTTPGGT